MEIAKFKNLYINNGARPDSSEPVSAMPYPLYQDVEVNHYGSSMVPKFDPYQTDKRVEFSGSRMHRTLPVSPFSKMRGNNKLKNKINYHSSKKERRSLKLGFNEKSLQISQCEVNTYFVPFCLCKS